jgi:hypothetical protein
MRNVALLTGLVGALCAQPAAAYPWMVKHNYGSCVACHVDPSGAGQLTPFGRTESERVVRWRAAPATPGEPPSTNSRFLWFLELPEAINLSGNLRYGALVQPGVKPVAVPLEMATDVSASVTLAEVLVLQATGGFGRRDVVAPAIVAPRCDPAAVGECGPSFLSRTFWAGLKLAEGAVLLRGGAWWCLSGCATTSTSPGCGRSRSPIPTCSRSWACRRPTARARCAPR